MDTPHTHVWHDERGRRITSTVYIGPDIHAHRFTDRDGPDDAVDRPVLDGDAEADGDPAADAGTADATDPDTRVGVVGL